MRCAAMRCELLDLFLVHNSAQQSIAEPLVAVPDVSIVA